MVKWKNGKWKMENGKCQGGLKLPRYAMRFIPVILHEDRPRMMSAAAQGGWWVRVMLHNR